MTSFRVPPTFIVATPSSHPLMTCPRPMANENGWPLVFELSNTFPSASVPVYST